MKKFLTLLPVCIALMVAMTVYADAIGIQIDGQTVDFSDAMPYVENGRTLVPVRAVADAMGASVEWIESKKTVVFTKNVASTVYDGKTYKELKEKYGDINLLGIFRKIKKYILQKLPKVNREYRERLRDLFE